MSHDSPDNTEQPAAEPRVLAPRKKWLFRLVAVGIPTTIGIVVLVVMMIRYRFLVVEPETMRPVIQRPFYLQEPGYETTGHRYLFDAKLGWRNIPNWQATTHGKSLTINSRGLRDRDYPFKKPADVTRILVLGDSFTWGYGVADDEIFTEVLETRLAESAAEYEVINSGVSGWGTDQEYLFLVNEGFRYAPDIVVLAFFLLNDPVENVSSRVYEMNKPMFLDDQLTLANVPVPKPHVHPGLHRRGDEIAITLAIMKAMSQECKQHGATLVVMKFGRFLLPSSPILLGDEQVIEEEIGTWPDTLYFDLDREFEAEGLSVERLTSGNSDGHWNAFGHQATAEMLYEFLFQSRVLENLSITTQSIPEPTILDLRETSP